MSTNASTKRQREPLPLCTLVVTCNECDTTIAELDTNTWTLAGVVMRARREHAASAHGWTGEVR